MYRIPHFRLCTADNVAYIYFKKTFSSDSLLNYCTIYITCYKSGTYLLSSFSIMSLGPAGVQTYGDKNPEVVINGNKLIVKWNDGNISEKMFVSSKLMLPVYTLSGKEVKLPLYKLDNDRAVRAVKMKDSGNVYILEYVYNVNMKKYVHEFSYYLK